MATVEGCPSYADDGEGGPSSAGWMSRAFRSLRARNYRLYAGAQLVSVTGTWMQIVAENWLVIRLTGSGLALGITTALQFLPLAFAAPYGGVLVDRMDKRHLLMASQTCAGLLALATGLLTLLGLIRVWMVFAAALSLGFVNAVDNPARQAFTLEMVGPGDVANATALNNSITLGSRAFGPALSGFLIARAGLGWAFVANALTYFGVTLALVGMRRVELFGGSRIGREPGQARKGLTYAIHRPEIRTTLLILAVVSTFGFNFQVLLSLLVAKTFESGAQQYGFLMSAMGVGSIVGALIEAASGDPTVQRVRLLAVAFGVTWAIVGLTPSLGVGYLAAVPMGAVASMFLSASASSLQLMTDDAFRGRIMALYTVAFLGTAPIGGPAMGYLAQVVTPRAAVLFGAAASAVAALFGSPLRERAIRRR